MHLQRVCGVRDGEEEKNFEKKTYEVFFRGQPAFGGLTSVMMRLAA